MSSRGINKVILVGNIGNDPDTKFTQGGMAVTKISLATTSSRKNKNGDRVDETQWHRVTFFGKLGEIAGEYLRKGSQVYVEGSIRYDKYTDSAGIKKYTTDIIADHMQMLGGGQRDGEAPTQSRRGSRPAENRPPSRGSAPPPLDDFSDDDIGF